MTITALTVRIKKHNELFFCLFLSWFAFFGLFAFISSSLYSNIRKTNSFYWIVTAWLFRHILWFYYDKIGCFVLHNCRFTGRLCNRYFLDTFGLDTFFYAIIVFLTVLNWIDKMGSWKTFQYTILRTEFTVQTPFLLLWNEKLFLFTRTRALLRIFQSQNGVFRSRLLLGKP